MNRTRLISTVASVGAVLAGAAAWGVLVAGGTSSSEDSGRPANAVAAAPLPPEVQVAEAVALTVISAAHDGLDLHLEVRVEFSARPDLGDRVSTFSLFRVVERGGVGTAYVYSSASISDDDAALIHLTFEGVPDSATGPLALEIDSIAFANEADIVAARGQPSTGVATSLPQRVVMGRWRVLFATPIAAQRATSLSLATSAAVGSTTVTVERLLTNGKELVIFASVRGFSGSQLEDLKLIPAYLRLADGTAIENLSYRADVAGDVARVQIRFKSPPGGAATLELPINVNGVSAPGQQMHPEAWAGSSELIGKSFRIDLRLP